MGLCATLVTIRVSVNNVDKSVARVTNRGAAVYNRTTGPHLFEANLYKIRTMHLYIETPKHSVNE